MSKLVLPNGYSENTILKTIRIKETKLIKIEELSYKHNLSVNKLINICLDYALDNLEEENSAIKKRND